MNVRKGSGHRWSLYFRCERILIAVPNQEIALYQAELEYLLRVPCILYRLLLSDKVLMNGLSDTSIGYIRVVTYGTGLGACVDTP